MWQYDNCGGGHFGKQVWFMCLKLQEKFCFPFPETQSGSVERDHWRSSGPSSLLKQVSPEHRAQGCVHEAFEYLQRRRLHNLELSPGRFGLQLTPLN